jgi:hypothetical protein
LILLDYKPLGTLYQVQADTCVEPPTFCKLAEQFPHIKRIQSSGMIQTNSLEKQVA